MMRMAAKRAAFEERYDGAHRDEVFATSYETAIREADVVGLVMQARRGLVQG
jgi:hypothetical protein